jgi:hypothetical protein
MGLYLKLEPCFSMRVPLASPGAFGPSDLCLPGLPGCDPLPGEPHVHVYVYVRERTGGRGREGGGRERGGKDGRGGR